LLSGPHDHAKSGCNGTSKGILGTALGRSAFVGVGSPTATADDARRIAFLISTLVVLAVPILAPLVHVAEHVIQPPGIWCVTAHRRWASEERTLGRVAGGAFAVEIRMIRHECFPVRKRCVRPRTGGVLPFRLRRKAH